MTFPLASRARRLALLGPAVLASWAVLVGLPLAPQAARPGHLETTTIALTEARGASRSAAAASDGFSASVGVDDGHPDGGAQLGRRRRPGRCAPHPEPWHRRVVDGLAGPGGHRGPRRGPGRRRARAGQRPAGRRSDLARDRGRRAGRRPGRRRVLPGPVDGGDALDRPGHAGGIGGRGGTERARHHRPRRVGARGLAGRQPRLPRPADLRRPPPLRRGAPHRQRQRLLAVTDGRDPRRHLPVPHRLPRLVRHRLQLLRRSLRSHLAGPDRRPRRADHRRALEGLQHRQRGRRVPRAVPAGGVAGSRQPDPGRARPRSTSCWRGSSASTA